MDGHKLHKKLITPLPYTSTGGILLFPIFLSLTDKANAF